MKALKLVFVAVALFVGVPLVVGSMGWSGSALVLYAIPSIVAMVWSLTDNTRQAQS